LTQTRYTLCAHCISKNQISEAKRSEANWFILKLHNIEVKQTGSIVILYFKQQQKSKLSFKKKTEGNKRKGSIVNY
jgi:hypothetical protein